MPVKNDEIDLLDDVRDGLDPEDHEKGPEEKYGHRPQIVVQPECLAAEKIKKRSHGPYPGCQPRNAACLLR
jgi:hypothetical protein